MRLEGLVKPNQVFLAVTQTFTAYSSFKAVRKIHKECVLIFKDGQKQGKEFIRHKCLDLTHSHLVYVINAFVQIRKV